MGLKDTESTTQNGTTVERKSDRELVVTRSFDAPARIVFEAWTRPELFMRWWAPKSMGVPLRTCEMDARTGGSYRIEFGHDAGQSWAFFGKYIEVIPNARLVWTNDEGEDDGAVTTVTFEEEGGRTLLTFHELYPSKEALDEAFVGMEGGMVEQLAQLDALLGDLGAGAGES
ncbi:MAG: SRPBCC family protein [Sphingomonas sp.]